jgi:hypothetical protein
MPPKSTTKLPQQATTPDQMKFVMTWLANGDNRLSCFGGAGAKAAYGGKSVVKPSTAYNALAQAVNKKFNCSWDGDSAKSRIRTMKNKFHSVFTLSNGGRVHEETAAWKLTDADTAAGILTLLDKAQHQCPYWNSWMEWCGSDPNLNKHGSGGSELQIDESDAEKDEPGGDGKDSESQDDEDGEEDQRNGAPAGFAAFTADRNQKGDEGNKGDGDEDQVPRAVASRVDPSTSGSGDAIKEQQKRRREMLSSMSAEQKTQLYKDEAKAKRQKEMEDSKTRQLAISDAATPGGPAQPPSTSTSGSPFSKQTPMSKDWQATFLVEHKRFEIDRAERAETSQVAVAKLQLASAERRDQAELEHKKSLLSFQQMQHQLQQQQVQMQMQFQHQQQMMYVFVVFMLRSHSITGTCK